MNNRSRLLFCIVFALCAAPSPGKAAPVQFVGTVTATDPALWTIGTAVSLTVDYTPTAALIANINSAVLQIGNETWNAGAVANGLTLTQNAGTDNDTLNVLIPNFGVSANSGWGTTLSNFSLNIFGTVDASDLTQPNVDALARFGTPSNGAFGLLGGLPAAVPGGFANTLFAGTAVPEPGSVALLSGLGFVFGLGAWRRRRYTKLEIISNGD